MSINIEIPSIEHWDLRQKIGQIVMCGFYGTEPSPDIIRLIRDDHVGGIIYFRRNIREAGQVRELSAALQRTAADGGHTLPLLISVDQEGGMVARIDRGVTVMPGNMALGATREAELAYDAARMTAKELKQIGINMNFAPCLDVNNNPHNPVIGVRSYGEDPKLVAELGCAAIRGYQAAGVAACAKHFPGHGDTIADSHLEMPLVPHGLDRLQAIELAPFRAALQAGVDAVMTAHVRFPAYDDSGTPATLSPAILGGLLRNELGYGGVIVTDCLEMKAIADGTGVASGAVKAVQAGADLVLISHTASEQLKALDALYEAVQSGILLEARIDEAVNRIVRLKHKVSADLEEIPPHSKTSFLVSTEQHQAMARRISEHSITLVRNGGGIPLRRDEPTLTIWPEVRQATEVVEMIEQEMTLGRALKPYMAEVREMIIGTEPTAKEVEHVLTEARSGRYKQIVVGTYNAAFDEGQLLLLEQLSAVQGVTLVVAALRNPYDIMATSSRIDHYLACYENRPLMMEALAKVLTGELEPVGQLPVTLPIE